VCDNIILPLGRSFVSLLSLILSVNQYDNPRPENLTAKLAIAQYSWWRATMVNFLKKYFSPDKKAARLEKEMQRALSANNQQKMASIFCDGFTLLLRKNRPELLSRFVISYCSKIENITLEKAISSAHIKQAISLLDKSKFDTAALIICDHFGYFEEAIDILAKRGQVNELSMRLSKENIIDKELLQTAVILWEKYNGDIRKSSTMGNVLLNISKFAPESIPDNPRVREIIGQFKEAAILYLKEGDLKNAARCYSITLQHLP